ncbi:MAG: PadR family transcriptional regulator [Planctomycetota bacterium]
MGSVEESEPSGFASCPCQGATVTRFVQPLILSVLVEADAHGYEILQRILATRLLGDEPPSEAGVYRTLREMAKRGLVASQWDTTGSGPARNVYRLTADGRRCLALWRDTIASYRSYLGRLHQRIGTVLDG